MQLRVIRDIGRFRCGQRLRMDNFHARQLIEVGIAVADESLEPEQSLPRVDEVPAGIEDTVRPKRRHRRRGPADST